MNALGILSLLVHTFGAFAYGAVLLLAIGEFGARGWAGQPRSAGKLTQAEIVGGGMLTLGFVWFVTNVALTIQRLAFGFSHSGLELLTAYLAFLYPPLIMHVTYAEHAAATSPHETRPSAAWRRAVWAGYALIPAVPVWATLTFAGVLPGRPSLVNAVFTGGLSAAFIVASTYSVAMSARYARKADSSRERLGNRAMEGMFGLTVVLFLLLLLVAFTADARPGAIAGRVIELAAKSLPLAFLFVGAYFESRYEFFDVLVKRGLSLFVTIAVLTAFFAAFITPLGGFNAGSATPWIYAVILLPVVLALPWIHTRISSELDRRWLGRRFTTVDAVKQFIATLRSATTQTQLVDLAQQSLGEIFGAPALVRLDRVPDAEPAKPGFDVAEQVPISTAAGVHGAVLMGRRVSEAPYFSEDVALLTSLADVFASVLDNLQLQARKREQEQLAQDLSLQASRSELKALRAQINPHFLFNALNAIAGLIHRNPAGADRTIEQLADVFRYALRGAESEWAVLNDELEFVRAYLEVERARFGDRLQVEVRVDNGARGARVPTMMVQTLVENAVKHGLAELRGAAIVRVDARCEGGRLTVSVMDNGPGFTEMATGTVRAQPRAPSTELRAGPSTELRAGPSTELRAGPSTELRAGPSTELRAGPSTELRAGGYGLANIRQRLHGYFGAEGVLTIDRDDEQGLTIVSVSIPDGSAR